jgi:hypothetical protein
MESNPDKVQEKNERNHSDDPEHHIPTPGCELSSGDWAPLCGDCCHPVDWLCVDQQDDCGENGEQ